MDKYLQDRYTLIRWTPPVVKLYKPKRVQKDKKVLQDSDDPGGRDDMFAI